MEGISDARGWTVISPDEHGDWLKQRDDSFRVHIAAGIKDKDDESPRVFSMFSLGVVTNRDAWACSPSKSALGEHMGRMIRFYNSEVSRFDGAHPELSKRAREAKIEGFINTNPASIAWTRALKNELAKGSRLQFDVARIVPSLYRPFSRHWLYFDRKLNEMVYQMPRLFPASGVENRVIGVSSGESRSGFSVLMADIVPSLHATDMVGSQYFPLYVYDSESAAEDDQPLLGAAAKTKTSGTPARRNGITDAGLAHFQAAYPGEKFTKEDVFYYVYGILHSPDYRERYADNLGKELPRIPRVKTPAEFWAFSKAGRALGDLHVGYEKVPEHPARIEGPAKPTAAQYRVEKMKFGKGKDKTVIHYNDFIAVRDIPLEAYDYVVNGKPAIEWVMERQSVTTDKASGIVKDANAWATETVGDARYPLSLLLRVITVSLETMKIVRGLPKLDILDEAAPADAAPASGPGAKVLPFRRVTPKPTERFTTCVPLVPLHAAAGGFSEAQEDLPELDDPAVEWVLWDGAPRFAEGMFVAQVEGRSMEPAIPDGAYCLFRRASLPSSPDRPVLVRHGGTADPETGGQYTVKHYREEKRTGGAKRIVLDPANAAFEPIVIAPAEGDEVQIVAEVVSVLGT